MKIILAPSKAQHVQATGYQANHRSANFAKSIHLFQKLRQMTKSSLGQLMKIQGELLDETYACYQNFQPNQPMMRAIDCYEGVVFREIQSHAYDEKQLSYMKEHLVILSAMYGVLEPHFLMWPYRLDLTMKPAGMNLYAYWQEAIVSYFADHELIVNLASEEFQRLLRPLEQRMIHVQFYERKPDHSLRVVSYHAKQARGRMAHQLILHHVQDVQSMKSMVIEGYRYDEERSDTTHLVYVKSQSR